MVKKADPRQLSLFDGPISENEVLWNELNKLKDSQERTRRKLFKELKEIQQMNSYRSSFRKKLINKFLTKKEGY
ncbi:MAG: hypothetical protein ACE5RC_00055 [Nitrosopumilus sp.]